MSRLTSAILLWIVLLGAGAIAAQAQSPSRHRADADDALMNYLERHGLNELLASHIEDSLRVVEGRRKLHLAGRLAQTYSALHAGATTLDDQRKWETLGLDLLERYPEKDSIEFRLSLAQTSFRRLEHMAEQSLLRLESAPDRGEIVRSLVELLKTLESIAEKSDRRVGTFQRQLESARAEETRLIDDALSLHQRYRSQSSYLAGYTALYIARLARERSSAASRASLHFATVLNANKGQVVDPADVPTDLLGFDHVARSALGSAHASALKADLPSAEQWFGLLEDSQHLSEAVASELPGAKLRAYAVANRWNLALEQVNSQGNTPMPPLDARRLAVLVFEGTSIAVEQDAREALAQRALSDLIAQAETGHVLQLVARFDISEINPTGFVGTYVRALKRYESARQGHRAFSSEHAPLPLSSGELAAAYTRAADEFANALNAHDTRDYPRAEGSVRMLAGLSYFYAGPRNQNMIAASEQFVLTSDFLHAHDPARAANALWMAIRSLDIHLETIGSSDPSVRERRLAILARFLGQYPEHPRASNLVYQRAISGELPPERSIDDLLGITRSSSVHDSAQRHAARLLYGMMTDDLREPNTWRRSLFLDLTETLMERDIRQAMPNLSSAPDSQAALRAAQHARRLFEIALAYPPRDDKRAQRALDALSTLTGLGLIEIDAIDAEIHYKRAKLFAARGDLDAARESSELAGQSDERFARAGDLLLFREAVGAFDQDDGTDDERRAQLASRVVEAGRPLLLEMTQAQGGLGLQEPGRVSIVYRVAIAANVQWQILRDPDARSLAHVLYRQLARAYPLTIEYILPASRLERELGHPLDVLPYWRTILSSTDPLSQPWLEAKHAIIEAQIATNPDRAREILDQFDVLHPGFADPIWAPKLRQLRIRLGSSR